MISVSPSTPFGYSIFCDDIRYEVSNKVSFIGVYAGVLLPLHPFPLIVPKLAIRVSYFERLGESTDPVELRIYLPGASDDAPTYRTPLPVDQVRSAQPDPKLAEAAGTDIMRTIMHDVQFSPLILTQEGLIKVRAYRGDLEIRVGSLFVQSPVTMTPQISASDPQSS